MLQQQLASQNAQQQSSAANHAMMQMMQGQQSQPFGAAASALQHSTGLSAASGAALMNRFGEVQAQAQQQQQQQQQNQPQQLFPNSFFDNNRSADFLNLSQQGVGGIQSNLRQLEMANDLLQRRLSMGFGSMGGQFDNMNAGYGGNAQMFNNNNNSDRGDKGMGSFGVDHLQGLDTSNLEGLMASQLQQQHQQQLQQQQLSLQQQLMMAQQEQTRRASLGGGPGSMDAATLHMHLQSMRGQGGGSGRMDMPHSLQQLSSQFHYQQQHQGDDMAFAGKALADDGKKQRKKKAKTFPEKLMQAITAHGEEDAVAWLPDGKSFVIVNDDLFVEKVLNNVFKESKYTR